MTVIKKLDMNKTQITMNNRISQPCKRKKSFTYTFVLKPNHYYLALITMLASTYFSSVILRKTSKEFISLTFPPKSINAN